MPLTAQQFQVLELMFIGKTNEEIAQILNADERLVRGAVMAVMNILGACNRHNAIYIALRRGLLKMPTDNDRATLQKTPDPEPDDWITICGVSLSPGAHRVRINGKDVHLGLTEFNLLQYLMTHPGRALTRSQILDGVWGSSRIVEERTVDRHIFSLREVLEHHGYACILESVRGVGYRCVRAAT